MSSAMAGVRRYTVSCPSCGTAATIADGGPDADRRSCSGCGSPLVILRTDTMCMAAIPTPPAPGSLASTPGAGAADIADLWRALAQRR